mgnify:CR=1 FL=1
MWAPSPERAAQTGMGRFMARAGKKSYQELHAWSVRESEAFWNLMWDFGEVRGEKGARTLIDGAKMPGAKWFPDGKLNFAENLLRRRDDAIALVFWGEDKVKRQVTHAELYALVSRIAAALRASGVKAGDRVAGYLPNLPESIAALLAASSMGAIW